jgi:hypothetical protein
MDDWPFDQPPNCAVISLRQIADGDEPVLHVTYDSDDHGWQFLGWGDARIDDGIVLCLAHILEKDSSRRVSRSRPGGRSSQAGWSEGSGPATSSTRSLPAAFAR